MLRCSLQHDIYFFATLADADYAMMPLRHLRFVTAAAAAAY